jgi:ABC-type cobalt transport system substrate-binding protein
MLLESIIFSISFALLIMIIGCVGYYIGFINGKRVGENRRTCIKCFSGIT